MKVIPVGNDSLQFQHSCMCGAHGERENCVTGVEPSLKEHLLKFHSLLYVALII